MVCVVVILNVRVHLALLLFLISSFDSNLYRSKNNFSVYYFNRRTFSVLYTLYIVVDSVMSLLPWDQAKHVPPQSTEMEFCLDENK